jgi:hypothetical protein
MCKVIDDILPVVGAIGGALIGGPFGAAIGGGLGGFTGNYAQTHNFGDAALGGLEGGVGGYFGGNGLADALQGLGSAGVGAGYAGFDMGTASTGATTLGGLETGTGGASLFGPMSGTGTAIGDAAGALGGGGLGAAGGDALSGISGASGSYLGGLGGSTQGTGLGLGSQMASNADLSGVGSATNTAANGVPGTVNSPLGTVSNTNPMGATTPTPGTTPTPANGAAFTDASQSATTGSGAPVAFDGGASMEGAQAAAAPQVSQAGLSTMFGPQSTAAMSPMGSGIAGTAGDVSGNGVQFGALGEGTASAPGAAAAASDIPGQSIGSNYAQAATSAQQGGGGVNDFLNQLFGVGQGGATSQSVGQLSPWLGLAKSGLGAYQQYAQQQANNNYTNSINQMFAPDSPYAQQMATTLARQDAAAGRNSQYGNRAVQLAAALTQARANALGNSNYARAATATPGASMLNSLFSTMGNPQYAQGMANLGSSAFNSLSNLFGS